MITIHQGDCRGILAALPPESVHCAITSPPYWSLRDYGVPPSIWGGEIDCEHEWGEGRIQDARHGAFCRHCTAWRGQLGLEPTPDLYVEHIVQVMRAARRVLRDDGTLWLNLGDSYTSGGRKSRDPGQSELHPAFEGWDSGRPDTPPDLKPKDLVGIPWMVAFALRDDGWWLRSDIIWHKTNAMPESVRDRPTTAHEHVFLLSKRARYYYDQDAIREPQTGTAHSRGNGSTPKDALAGPNTRANSSFHKATAGSAIVPGGRNRRTVWSIPTRPFSGAHFATFPPDLVEPMIKAGSPEGGAVLDPFFGAGTVGLVADRLGRDCIGIELNPDYAAMAEERIRNDAPMLARVEVESEPEQLELMT